ncbi:NAD-dependent succinate-semialdehyde dehydrogenase [Siminovitchia terrae]|uniref:NAD-dependent succinate-semialdehyde dehydrogenase n=1 Tax=Siminovitchia terrae TaxID=1914933 RepID=UPI001B286EBB|nr:NAD-dependent succinate-semialdehyde dehydrogenase [Siminovitchia terrae]GIN92429.1 NAD-dependent succinate-semialdehyde dehydrogenase [Siminovitchia terrae]
MSTIENFNFLWINGEKVTTSKWIDIINPSTGEIIGKVPDADEQNIEQSIVAASNSFENWASMPADQRATYLQAWADRILNNQEKLAHILSLEQGKPLHEAMGEIYGTHLIIRWFAEQGKRVYGEIVPSSRTGKQLYVLKKPVGVVGLITPANIPAAILANKVAPALAAGCTAILKPAEQTPMIAIALIDELIQTNIPKGVINILTGDGKQIGDKLVKDERVKKIAFTGSTRVGKVIMENAASHIKRLTLELGGNCPVILFPDTDIEKGSDAIIANKFENCGQVCNGINIVYVHETIKDDLLKALQQKISQLTFRLDGQYEGDIGPMIDGEYLLKVERLVEDAVTLGADILVGGSRLKEEPYSNGYYYQPTLLSNITPEMALTKNEIFGPVLPVMTFKEEDEIIQRCNVTPNALAAYVFTRDAGRMHRLMDRLEFGNVGINTTSLACPQAPFGGAKESGLGRVGGHQGLEEYLELRYVAMSPELVSE